MTPIFIADLVDEDDDGVGSLDVAGELAQRLATSGGHAGRLRISPISPLDLGAGVSAATESTTMTSTAPERTSMSVISSACSPVSGWDTSRSSMLTPSLRA
jgi:hypothetical protein